MKLWVSIIFALFSLQVAATELLVLKYEDLPKLVAKNSKDVRAAELLTQASRSRQGFKERARYPKIDLESGLRGIRELDGSGDSAPFFKVEGSFNLYRGGRDALRDTLQEKETAIRSEETQLVLRDQLSAARELYVKLASVRDLKKAWTNAIKIAEQQKKSSRTKVNAGLTTATDLLEFELHESALKRDKRNLDKEEHELSSRLRIILGFKEDVELSLSRTYLHPPEPKGNSSDFSPASHPAVRKLSLQADHAETIGRSGSSRWLPEVNLFASYEEYLKAETERPGAIPKRDIAAGIRVSIPLGDNLGVHTEALAKGIEAQAYQLQKQHSEQQIMMRYEEYLHDMKVLHDLIHDAEVQVQKAKKYLNLASVEYERGLKNGPDVLEACRTLYTTEVETIKLRYEFYLAEVGLSDITLQ